MGSSRSNNRVFFITGHKRESRFHAVLHKGKILNPTLVIHEMRGLRQPIKARFRIKVDDKRQVEYLNNLMMNNSGAIDLNHKSGVNFIGCEVVGIIKERRKPGKQNTYVIEIVCRDFGVKAIMDVSLKEFYRDPIYNIPIGYKEVYKLR